MSDQPQTAEPAGTFIAPHPGSQEMPRWDAGALPLAPWFTLRNWAQLIGPGLVMGGAAIGGGEWLAGPLTTAKYGGAILWLSTVSILAQVIYNLEISRYTLYCGEPIFTGLFRVLPGPRVWLFVYIALDFGSVFPYLVANAATPLAAVILGRIPNVELTEPSLRFLGLSLTDKTLIQVLQYVVFLGVLVPLVIGGKVYTSLKYIMSFKVAVVLGFLTLVAVLYSSAETWHDILTGFVKFGSVPVKGAAADAPPEIDNIFVALWQGRPLPDIDFSMVAALGALAAISGCGGLTNISISGYTRDQGWGMGRHVGAIPSVVGGRKLALSHVGMVFEITADSVKRFRGWYRWVLRDQVVVWMLACFVGIALPSMLSVQFLPRGTNANDWVAAGMTADGVRDAVGPAWGQFFWLMILFCGFLVLAPSAVTTADGVLRRWVDVFWTSSTKLRQWEPHRIRYLYFGALCCYAIFGVIALTLGKPVELLKWATTIYNYALGFSCFHVLAVNLTLLPKELRPNWFIRIGLVVGGVFFLGLAVLATHQMLQAK
jgi:Mn2+/Fe2+ NRAMP family transporter